MRRISIPLITASLAVGAVAEPATAGPRRSGNVDVIVQLHETKANPASVVKAHKGRVTRRLPLIHGVGARVPRKSLARLMADPRVAHVGRNARAIPQAIDPRRLAVAYPFSVGALDAWNKQRITGKGVRVAVIDTGIAGNLPDFRVSRADASSRVVASAVVNPAATSARDDFGHGTHVAGILAGNSTHRSDGQAGRYAGVAPDADLVSVKVDDGRGHATVLDVIHGLQWVVDHKDQLGIRVVNLSLESARAESYRTDPLAAAVEAAWLRGLVVVTSAGNRGGSADAVSYAPGNDPYVITVGGADDRNTTGAGDDVLAPWSSRGTTQDGFTKPDVHAPGASVVSTLAPGSVFAAECPSCIVGAYIRASGTSMAAPVVTGVVALLLQKHPELTPDQVKGLIVDHGRPMPGGLTEVSASRALQFGGANPRSANQGLVPNDLLRAADGSIDYTKASWSKSSWSQARGPLEAAWAKASWSCASCTPAATDGVTPSKASWSKASWSNFWTP